MRKTTTKYQNPAIPSVLKNPFRMLTNPAAVFYNIYIIHSRISGFFIIFHHESGTT